MNTQASPETVKRFDIRRIGRKIAGVAAVIVGLLLVGEAVDINPNHWSTLDEAKFLGGAALAVAGISTVFTEQDAIAKSD